MQRYGALGATLPVNPNWGILKQSILWSQDVAWTTMQRPIQVVSSNEQ